MSLKDDILGGKSLSDIVLSISKYYVDIPPEKEIPDEIKLDPYLTYRLKQEEKELKFLVESSDEKLDESDRLVYQEQIDIYEQNTVEWINNVTSCFSILIKVLKWEPPTEKHVLLKNRVVGSIKNIILTEYLENSILEYISVFEKIQVVNKSNSIKILEESIKNLKKHITQERKSVKYKNLWLKQLKESLSKLGE